MSVQGSVCLRAKRDKARQSVGKRDGNSLRTDKEGA